MHVIKPFLLLYYMHILYYYIQLIINKLMRYTSLWLRPYRSYRHFWSLHNHVDVSGFHCIYIISCDIINLLPAI